MRVLVACEESQAVCIEFRNRGHEAYSCDIQECSGGHSEWHIIADVLTVLNGGTFITQDGTIVTIEKWDLMIAHPPCTYLSKAGACRLYPMAGVIDHKRYEKGVNAREFFMKLYNCGIKSICLENPVSLKIFNLPQFTQEIEPYQFGHPVSKRTRLWLINLPLIIPTDVVEKTGTYLPSSTSKFRMTDKNKNCVRGAKVASKTFPGIARAMAEQWG